MNELHGIGIHDILIVAQVIDFLLFHHDSLSNTFPLPAHTIDVTLDWKYFVELYELFISNEKLGIYGIELYINLTHFLISWISYMKHKFVCLIGFEQTPSFWKLGPKGMGLS
jgi:hypothetical protein